MSKSSPGSWCLGGGELRTVPDPDPGSLGIVGGCLKSHGCRNNSWPTWMENLKPRGPFFHLCPPWVLSGTRWDAGGSGPGREGFGGCRTPGLSLLPVPLPILGQYGWSSMGGFTAFMAGRGKIEFHFMCRNWLFQGSVFRQTSAFSSPTIHSLHRGAELQGPAVPSPGSGQRPQGRQCLKWGAAGRGCAQGLRSCTALPGMLWEVAALWAFWHPPRRSEHHRGCRSAVAQPVI